MARRLIPNNRVKEAEAQIRLLKSIERASVPEWKDALGAISDDLIKGFGRFKAVPPLQDEHRTLLKLVHRQNVTVAVRAFGLRVFHQQKSAPAMELKDFNQTLNISIDEFINSEMVRQRITNLTTETRARIVAIVAAGQEAGLSVDEIGAQLEGEIAEINALRSVLIGRTETHGAANFGADKAARSLGLDLQKEWIAVGDRRTRLNHFAADGQVVEMDQAFEVGGERLMFPGDPQGSGENVINCRCAVSHIVKE